MTRLRVSKRSNRRPKKSVNRNLKKSPKLTIEKSPKKKSVRKISQKSSNITIEKSPKHNLEKPCTRKMLVSGELIYNYTTKKAENAGMGYYFCEYPNDPVDLYTFLIPNRNLKLEKVYPPPSSKKDIQKCKGIYENDPVSLTDFSEYEKEEYNDIYIDGQRCFSLTSILHKMEMGFVAFDPQTKRVLPLYPSDFSNHPFPPHVFRSIVLTSIKRGLRVKRDYPIVYTFYNEHTNLLEAIYTYINQYRELTNQFIKVSDPYAAVRRDLIAIGWMKQIYEQFGIYNVGYRKYTNIESTNSHGGTQIFYQAILLSYLLSFPFVLRKKGDVDEETDYYWAIPKKNEMTEATFRGLLVVRQFVSYNIIHR